MSAPYRFVNEGYVTSGDAFCHADGDQENGSGLIVDRPSRRADLQTGAVSILVIGRSGFVRPLSMRDRPIWSVFHPNSEMVLVSLERILPIDHVGSGAPEGAHR